MATAERAGGLSVPPVPTYGARAGAGGGTEERPTKILAESQTRTPASAVATMFRTLSMVFTGSAAAMSTAGAPEISILWGGWGSDENGQAGLQLLSRGYSWVVI